MNTTAPAYSVREAVEDTAIRATVEELRRQRDTLQERLDAIARHDRAALNRLHLYTGQDMIAHAIKVRTNERARYTPAEQAAARAREHALEEQEREAFRARR